MNAPEASQRSESRERSDGAASTDAADRRALLTTCVAAAVRAAAVIRDHAARLADVEWEEKGPADFVSRVDREAEDALTAVIRERHADAHVVAEEGAPALPTGGGALAFVADPLDGTTNFLHGFPWYCVSVAALVDREPVAGAILNAANGELFTAVAGGGARRGGQPIRVSRITEPKRALIGTGFPFKDETHVPRYLGALPTIMTGTAGIRRPGSAALDLADVACGRFEAFWELMLAPWDVAAGILLVREAGGIVTNMDGAPAPVDHTSIVAGNPAMHAWLLQALRPAPA